ncbi:hypothetical protein AOC36_09655 [Erysipelothrix larvae]|uniref:Helix-turn-helix domain-containing protein n=1 Tax=Erysipelothrix larvae TaxID=1514105 RepID=A0A0X8H1A2_9FIRM|nr:helix-turn-helix domain-containing protein [Erysipelothrix larvae]AMC94238.1 hypothetical protein AOC36_09655 [Erysipelothrix larvae]
MVDNPSYYSVTPADVRYDNRLTDSEKLLYSEITALTQSSGECWATNEYFANLYDVHITTISRRIANLKKYGYIDVVMIYKQNKKQIEKRIIRIANTYTQDCLGGISRNANTPISRNAKENNTSNYNNTSINNNTKVEKQDFTGHMNEFWSEYPRKEKRKNAFEKLKKILKQEPSVFNQIILDVRKRKKSEQWLKENGKYIPMPTTYLNERRWEDEDWSVNEKDKHSSEAF